jgi:probable phosphoglycerate mutase
MLDGIGEVGTDVPAGREGSAGVDGAVVDLTSTRTIHLVRHGESEWNAAGRVQGAGRAAPGLTDLGWQQADDVAEQLVRLVSDGCVCLSSDLLRARQTGGMVARRLGVQAVTDPRLRELDFGRYEGCLKTDVLPGGGTVQEAITRLWEEPDRPAPGGESVADLVRRVGACLTDALLTYPQRVIVVVAHGGVLRVARAALAGPVDAAIRLGPVANGEVLTLIR